MEINANISSAVASSISKLNLNTQKRSYEAIKEENKNENQQTEDISQELPIEPVAKKMAVDVEDIQKYAKYMGENLSIDDINYGLMYGRSVIADYSI